MSHKSFFKVLIEPPHSFDLYEVPTDAFKQYWQQRLELCEEAIKRLGNVVSKEEFDGNKFINIHDAMEETKLSAKYLLDLSGRGAMRKEKIDNVMYFNREDYNKILKQFKRRDTT